MHREKFYINNISIILVLFIFLLLLLLPVIFTRENGRIAWLSVIKIWQDRSLLVPLFIINHWFLVPNLALKKKYASYLVLVFLLIAMVTAGYYFYDKPEIARFPVKNESPQNHSEKQRVIPEPKTPQPIPPYADLLLFSLLLVAVDAGLSFTKHWHINEEDRVRLEKENIQAQLGMLRNQISPHFFMNTMNNIYSLIESDKERSKQAVMRLSKLMRYLLYENQNEKMLLSKEIEFIRNYVDLMKLRFVDEVEIKLKIPETYTDVEIPALLFISYLENAFKYGTSYQHKSLIEVIFKIENEYLFFSCTNNKNEFSEKDTVSGIGLQNSRQRLNLLYKNSHSLAINETDDSFSVKLKIPLK
jgi:hypothetical protein